jgi:hypothetical protein
MTSFHPKTVLNGCKISELGNFNIRNFLDSWSGKSTPCEDDYDFTEKIFPTLVKFLKY